LKNAATGLSLDGNRFSGMKYLRQLLLLLFLLIVSPLQAQDTVEDRATGMVRESSGNSISMRKRTGGFYSVGFQCEPTVCAEARNLIPGERIVIYLGSNDRTNVLIGIRKCEEPDEECDEVENIQLQRHKETTRQWQLNQFRQLRCALKMRKDLKNKDEYVYLGIAKLFFYEYLSSNEGEPENSSEEACLDKILSRHVEVELESCKKYNCGENIGGGCYHMAGQSITESIYQEALKRCRIAPVE